MLLRTRLGLVAALLTALFSASALAQIPQSERDALIAFYNSTGGANWTNSTGWNGPPGTECTWFRVECDEASANVTSIGLAENNLSGTLPSVAGLPYLQQLYVQDNQLTGTIPALAGLTNLRYFYANGNQLTGTIPALAGLANLILIDVSGNQLSGAIPSLSGLTSLAIFNAQSNQLGGTIPALAGLSNLIGFAVDDNALTGSIPALGGLPALQQFAAAYNRLTGPIPALAGLSELVDFNVVANQLSGSIPPLAGLGKLQSFFVDDNNLTGSIPPLSGLDNLKYVHVAINQLTGSIPALNGLPNLVSFDAETNQLSGAIPDLAALTKLSYFSVARNHLSGAIPALTGLAELTILDVSYNQLSGSIPALSGLNKLQQIYLGLNQLSGSIPALAGLSALQFFVANDNNLSGTIPALSGLANLHGFNVGDNQLSGALPALTGLTSLAYFSVTGNQLTALSALNGLTSLNYFDASYNRLGGSIPALAGLNNLQIMYLGFNRLTGSIPALTGLSNLQELAVDDNELSGSIPSLIGLGNLQGFLAASNQLSGTIPALTGLGNLQYLQVGNNRLSGAIPTVPAPNNLTGGLSSLCPNALAPTADAAWDAATGLDPWYSTCASDESNNGTPTNKNSTRIEFSRDGLIEVFQSQQTDLTSNTANAGGQDVYSVGTDGQPVLESVDSAGNKLIGTASLPAVSSDGKVVAFVFTPGAAKSAKDLATGQMFAGSRGQPKHQVDMGMGSVPPNGAATGAPSLSSANGVNQLVFCSSASNLVPSDGNTARDIFLVDPLNPAIAAQRVSVDGSGAELSGDSCEPKLSGDGSKMVFSLSAPSLFGTPVRQIVRKDLPSAGKALFTGQLLPITTSSTGQGATSVSYEPTTNQDGSVVAFTSAADLDGLGMGPYNTEVFVSLPQGNDGRLIRRLHSDKVAVPADGTLHPQISADGTTVVMQTEMVGFSSAAPLAKDLAGAVVNQCGAMAITTNFFQVTPLGGAMCGVPGSTVNQNPSISGDGITTGFDSNAPQSNGSTNSNTYAQGVGVNTDITGNSVANLSGDYSGQWYDPNQSGQGLVIDVTNPDANNGRLMILTWFVFSGGHSTWVQGVGIPKAGAGSAANTVEVQMDQVGIFKGTSFPLGQARAMGSAWGSITLTFTDANTGSMRWTSSYPGFNSGSMPIKHFLSVGLPAQDAPGAQVKSCYSGNWFNPAQSGHGFEFEVLPTTPALLAVDWFAYAPDGSPVWLQGVGPINGNGAQVQLQLIDGAGAQFPPNFNPGTISQHVWGTATFTFTDASHGSVTWNSTIPGYGSGTQPLQPIVRGLMDRRGCQ